MNLLGWLKNLLLPFENPDHPLHSPKPYDPGDDPEWDLTEPMGTGGPNSFYKPPTWKQWGGKWYKQTK